MYGQRGNTTLIILRSCLPSKNVINQLYDVKSGSHLITFGIV